MLAGDGVQGLVGVGVEAAQYGLGYDRRASARVRCDQGGAVQVGQGLPPIFDRLLPVLVGQPL